jgi:hypothetical protein
MLQMKTGIFCCALFCRGSDRRRRILSSIPFVASEQGEVCSEDHQHRGKASEMDRRRQNLRWDILRS